MIKLIDIKGPQLGEYVVELEGVVVHFIFEASSAEAALFEARHRGTPLGSQYSAVLHKAHVPGGQDHLHLFAKQNQIAALNRDGTAHDRSHGVRIPNRVADAIRTEFPNFVVPPNNFIESAPSLIEGGYQLLFG